MSLQGICSGEAPRSVMIQPLSKAHRHLSGQRRFLLRWEKERRKDGQRRKSQEPRVAKTFQSTKDHVHCSGCVWSERERPVECCQGCQKVCSAN